MKILAIRGKNIASLAERFELNFESGALADSGLFAITGPTGSGKSSLLDAMCLPLFNETPRLNNSGGARIGYADSEENDRLRANSVRGLLTRGTASGYAEVDFLGVDGNRYCARWNVARARQKVEGRIKSEVLSLENLDSNQKLGGSKKETLEVIRQKLGLDFDQFRRSVLLAQGDFAAFLKADSKDRGELLEQMTGTEIYAKISSATFRRAKKEYGAQCDLEKHLQHVEVLDEEQRQELDARIGALAAEETACVALVKTLEKELQWFQLQSSLKEGITESENDLRVKLNAWRGRENEEWQLPEIGDSGSVAAFLDAARPLVKQATVLDAVLVPARAQVVELQAEQASFDDDLSQLGAQIEGARTTLAATKAKRDEEVEWQLKNATSGPLAKDWTLHKRELMSHCKAVQQSQALALQCEEIEQLIPSAEEQCSTLDGEKSVAEEALNACMAAALEAQAAVKELPIPEIRRQQELLRRMDESLNQYRNLLVQRGMHLAEIEAQRVLWKTAKDGILASEKDGLKVNAKLDQAREDLKRAQDTLGMEGHRSELVDGESCPLCGSEDHPYTLHNPGAARLLEDQMNVVAKLEGTQTHCIRDLANLNAALQSAQLAGESAQKSLKASDADGTQAVEDWAARVRDEFENEIGELPVFDEAEPTLNSQISALQEKVAELQSHSDGQATQFDELTAVLETVRKDQDGKQLAANQSKVAADQAANRKDELRRQLQSIAKDLGVTQAAKNESRLVLEEAFSDDEWSAKLKTNADEYIASLQTQVDLWNASIENLSSCRERLPAEKSNLDHLVANQTTLQKRRDHSNAALLKAQDELAGNEKERRKLFGGDPIHEVDNDLREIMKLETQRAERWKSLAEHKQKNPPLRQPDQIKLQLLAQQQLENKLRTKLAADRVRQTIDQKGLNTRAELGPEIAAQQLISKRWNDLSGLIGQADGSKFRDFAQGLTLRIVLEYANEQLRQLRPRYELMAVPDCNLDMQVIDHDMADEVRGISSLSGGESFLVSLALALGLAESTGKSAAVESLFIDEGFGTLDSDTLEIAIATLDALQATGRTIGVISHVDGLADRLGVQVHVEKIGGGRSKVEVRDAMGIA